LDCPVVSKAKTIEVRNARDDPANMADMPTNAANGTVTPVDGNQCSTPMPNNAPAAPPMVSRGAKVPPEVPLPRAIAHERNLKKHRENSICKVIPPESTSIMLSYPTPNVRGAK